MVYRAVDRSLNRPVAIKALIDGDMLVISHNGYAHAPIADEPNFVHLTRRKFEVDSGLTALCSTSRKTLRGWIESDKRRPLPAGNPHSPQDHARRRNST